MKKLLVTLSVLSVVACAAMHLLSADPGVTPAVEAIVPAARVRTAAVEPMPASRSLRLHGLTRAADRAQLGFTQPGRLVERPVRAGDRVLKGDLLARQDRTPLRTSVTAAEAQVAEVETRLAQVRTEIERLDGLVEQGAAPTQRLDSLRSDEEALEASHRAARAAHQEARRRLREASLYAPFDGEIAAAPVEAGEVVGAGTPVVVLLGAGADVVVEVPQSVYSRVEPGAPAAVHLPGVGADIDAVVRSVAHSPAGPGRLFEVVLSLSVPVDPGLAAVAELDIPVDPALSVPLPAVTSPTGAQPAVWTVSDGVARRIEVQTGELVSGRVAVVGLLDDADEVVVAGFGALADGTEVEVLR